MQKYIATVRVDGEELAAVLAELEEAKETIYRCYSRLQQLDILTITKKEDAASGD